MAVEGGLLSERLKIIVVFQTFGVLLIGVYYFKGFDAAVKTAVLFLVLLTVYKLDVILKAVGKIIDSASRGKD